MAWSHILGLLESGLLKGREVGCLLAHALTPITHIFTLCFPVFVASLLTSFVFFLFLLVLSLHYSVLLFTMHIYAFLYYILWQGLPFLPLNYFWLVMGDLPGLPHWSANCPATTTILCWPHRTSFPNKSCFVLFSCFPSHSYLDKGWVSPLPTSIACT